jgi:hypothetical protein
MYNAKMKLRESDIQKTLCTYLDLLKVNYFAVCNERQTTLARGFRFKQMGVTAGVSDLVIYSPGASHAVLFLELKTVRGRATIQQRQFEAMVIANPQLVYCIAYGLEDAKNCVHKYLGT